MPIELHTGQFKPSREYPELGEYAVKVVDQKTFNETGYPIRIIIVERPLQPILRVELNERGRFTRETDPVTGEVVRSGGDIRRPRNHS